MKKLIILAGIAAIVYAVSCKKTAGVNPLADVANLDHGAYVTLDTATNLNFNYAALSASTVGIKVTQYPNGNDIDKVVVYVVKGANADPTAWKKVKTVTYAGKGTALTCTGAELATALGVSLSSFAAGDYYTFYNQIITKSGETYDISNINSALESGVYYNASFRWTAYLTCPFSSPMAGSYKVIEDDWADWVPGDIVQVTDGPATNQINLSLVWPGAAAGGHIKNALVVNVDPATGTASVPKVDFGTYGSSGTVYTAQNPGGATSAGYVFSCTGYITLKVLITAGSSSYGNNALILQKQ